MSSDEDGCGFESFKNEILVHFIHLHVAVCKMKCITNLSVLLPSNL